MSEFLHGIADSERWRRLGRRLVPRVVSEEVREQRLVQRNLRRAMELAVGPNLMALTIIKEAAALPHGSDELPSGIRMASERAVVLDQGKDIWRALLVTDVAPTAQRELGVAVPEIGVLPFHAPRLLPKQASQRVSALELTVAAATNMSGYVSAPTTRLRCFDAKRHRFLATPPYDEMHHIDIYIGAEGAIEKSQLYIAQESQPHQLCIQPGALLNMLVDAEGGVRDMLGMQAELEKITAGSGDF